MTAPHLLDRPHHDGSSLYVDGREFSLGDVVTVRLRVPRGFGETGVLLRVSRDGDPLKLPARVVRDDAHERWYSVDMPVDNPVVSYRWLLRREHDYVWLTNRGLFARDVSDVGDFRVTVFGGAPEWADDVVGYQVFPDRFARSAAADARPAPEWAVPAGWDDEPAREGEAAVRQFFGGDLDGIAGKLDHLQALGVNLLYLTPFFPARSAHRYDASTFGQVDPALGGDEALAKLARAVHERGMRLIGDLTTNHTGDRHEWFQKALADRRSVEGGFYYWAEDAPIDFARWQRSQADQWGAVVETEVDGVPFDYVSWLGVPSLPKLNWGSRELWGRMVSGPDSVMARYLHEPFGLDGWRIDVAHMTGRYAADDYYADVARAARATVDEVHGLLVGEHFYDLYNDQLGDGWQSVMNYQGFIKPLWSWLTRPATDLGFADMPLPIPRRPGEAVVATMRDFDGSVPWLLHSRQWNMLGSHDTARIATITGDPRLVEVGATWLFTYPGIPALFAGDEGGALGDNGEHSRTSMPWDQIAAGGGPRWDASTFERYRSLIALRRGSAALSDGGLRWAVIAGDAIAYLRETAEERVLVVLARAPWEGARLPGWLVDAGERPELLYGGSAAGTPGLSFDGDHLLVSGDGPAVGVWRLAGGRAAR